VSGPGCSLSVSSMLCLTLIRKIDEGVGFELAITVRDIPRAGQSVVVDWSSWLTVRAGPSAGAPSDHEQHFNVLYKICSRGWYYLHYRPFDLSHAAIHESDLPRFSFVTDGLTIY